MTFETTQCLRSIQQCIDRLKQGDEVARGQLLSVACARLHALTRQIKRSFIRVGRWEETDDIFQRAMIRLTRSLEQVDLNDSQHFLRLAATQIRRELIDLTRRIDRPHGFAANHATQPLVPDGDGSQRQFGGVFDPAELTTDPRTTLEWSEFHQLIDELPDPEREVVDLLWYHGMTQEEAASVLDVSPRTIRRIWRTARLSLVEQLNGSPPGA